MKIERDGKDYFINKTTAVWLLQEGERVSSDRLFRVRSKQPYSNGSLKNVSHPVSNQPSQCEHILVGDVCVFKYSGMSNSGGSSGSSSGSNEPPLYQFTVRVAGATVKMLSSVS